MLDYHMTLEDIDNTDLELLLDMEIVDSKIEAAAEQQRHKKGKKMAHIDQIL